MTPCDSLTSLVVKRIVSYRITSDCSDSKGKGSPYSITERSSYAIPLLRYFEVNTVFNRKPMAPLEDRVRELKESSFQHQV